MGKRGSGNSRPKSNSERNARKAGFKKNAGAHTPRCSGAAPLERVREREQKHRHIIYIELRKWANQNQGGRGAPLCQSTLTHPPRRIASHDND